MVVNLKAQFEHLCIRDGFKKKKKVNGIFHKGPDPASQHLNGKKNMV